MDRRIVGVVFGGKSAGRKIVLVVFFEDEDEEEGRGRLGASHFPSFQSAGFALYYPTLLFMSAAIDVSRTAELARLNLSNEEIATFQGQLSQVLHYVEKLEQVDVSAVEPTAHANAVFNVFRADESRPCFTPQEALANSPRQANQLFIVPKVIE